MKLTSEQRIAIACNEDVMLTACPGSGKTRVIVSKLSRVLDQVRDTPRAVACITYTNAAVHEIEGRLRLNIQPGDDRYYDICTIHSFCLNNIFRPFCHYLGGYAAGFKVLTPESEEFTEHVTAVCAKFGRHDLRYKDFEDFSQLRISLQGAPVGNAIESGGVSVPMALEYWRRTREAGLIDFPNIIYHALVLLRDHSEILEYVASKFAWMLVDEFQDTTDLQVEILALIADKGRTRFLLVGDPYQSIYRFAGARPDLADEFAAKIGARTDLCLTGNFRSSKPILAQAELLLPRVPAMEALGPSSVFKEAPALTHAGSAFSIIFEHFLPALDDLSIPLGDAAVLAPSWFCLFPLGRQLRARGVSIVGPGARPYRRNSHFAPLAEQVCGYLVEPRPEAIAGIERTLFTTLLDVTGRAQFNVFSYEGRTVVFRLLEQAQRLFDADEGAIAWLEKASSAFSLVLIEEGYLGKSEQAILRMSVEEMKTHMRNNKVDLDNLSVDELGIYARPDAALKLSTLHNAKGREYGAVAMIDLHEGRIPNYHAKTPAEIEEQRRLFYVGVTRAKRYLLYATDGSGQRNGPSRFLSKNGGVGVR